jgi:hypothetical protein
MARRGDGAGSRSDIWNGGNVLCRLLRSSIGQLIGLTPCCANFRSSPR